MKKLLMILAACATAMVAPAAVKTQVDFESGNLEGLGFTGTGGTIETYPNATRPGQPYPFSGTNTKYCAVDSEDKLTGPAGSGATCFDMYVQFPEGATTPGTDSLSLGENAKVAVYLDYDDNNKVCVVHGNGSGGTTITPTATTVNPGEWVRLTIAKVDGGYKVYINGVDVNSSAVFTSISSTDTDPSYVDFAGCGNLDNYVARTANPFPSTYEASFGTESEIVKFKTYSEAFEEALASGATTPITRSNSGASSRTLNGSTTNPYEITNLADLQALANAVNAGNTCSGKCFVQTANIDMTGADAFDGIGTDSKQFSGVYDGNDKTISNVTFTPRTYSGVFNSANNATIKNLTVDTVGFANNADGEYGGAAIVGKISGTSTLTNLVAKGSVGSETKPFTHNAAGVAVRVTGGNVTIVDCHNEAAVYGAYSKLAGIINLVQADSGSVVITNCSNSGAITASGTFVNDNKTRNAGDNGVAGILSYANMPVTITDCSNTGALTGPIGDGGAKIGQIVGWVQGKTLTDGGSNCASSAQGMIGHRAGGTVTGFQYATVANNVATTIAPPYTLAEGNTYLLEGNVGAGTVFTLAAEGDTIAFNTALGYAFGGTVAAAEGLVAKSSTSENVTTYTADEGYEVVSTAETTLVSVPKNCYAAELIDLSNRAAGDVLKVYSKDDSDKCYYTWTLSSEKAWMPAVTYKVSETDSTSHSKPASEVQLYAGQAAWLTRTDTSKDILLAVVAEGNTIPASVEKGWNMIAPAPKAGATTVALNEVVPAGSATDQIKIPTAGAPITCTYENEKWGYYKFIKNAKGRVTGKEWVSDVTIDAGTGFWYISDSEKTVNLK